MTPASAGSLTAAPAMTPAAAAPTITAPTAGGGITAAPLSGAEAGAAGATTPAASAPAAEGGAFSSIQNFMNSPYGKVAGKMLTGGGGKKGEGEGQSSTLGKLSGGIGNASRQAQSQDKQRQIQALIASGMDPQQAQMLVGGA